MTQPMRRCMRMGLAFGVAALLTFGVGVAQAEAPPLVANGYFHATAASGIAVNQSSGDVFVAGFLGLEFAAGPIETFNASDELLSSPAPFAEGFHYGVAVNPKNGDLYVIPLFAEAAACSEKGLGEVDIYDPNTGERLSSFCVPPFATESEGFFGLFFNEAQIAADSAGDVYVPNVPENKVLEYNEKGELQHEFTGSGTDVLRRPDGVAVDSSGDVWVADNGHNRIEEFSPTGEFLSGFESEGVKALALDGHGDVLAVVDNSVDFCGTLKPPCEHLVEYSSSGAQLFDAGAGVLSRTSGEAFNLGESMVAVNEESGRVYVTDGLKNVVWVFQPPVAPTLGQESAAEVGTTEAKLGALVNPGGAQTRYRFEYDTRPYAEGEGAHGTSVPFPEGVAGEGFSTRAVWAAAKGLTPGVTYYYRAIVTNGVGSVVGPDETFTTATLAQVACANEGARGGFSALLPDCRGYELVTPAGETSAQPDTGHIEGSIFKGNVAADDGNRFAYQSLEVEPGAQSAGLQFISTRGPEGWSTRDALPLQPYTGDRCTIKESPVVLRYSADLTRSVILLNNNHGNVFQEDCKGEAIEVAPGEPIDEENLLLADNETGAYQLINITPPGVVPTPPHLESYSADLNFILFSERAKLTPEAQSNTINLYEWHEGVVHVFKLFLPSGAPVSGELVGISPNGSEIFFKAGGKLYVRINDERTVQIDEARGGSGPGGGASFAGLSAGESQVFFSDEATAGLTSDTVTGSGTNLYRYDINSGQLTDLTPVAGADAAFADVGEDGSYLSFTSPAVINGTEANQFGEKAESGKENLYVDHDGAITFVMHGGGGVFSGNGAYFGFESYASLTGYDNGGQPEIYMYSAAANRFECASCNPDGETTVPGTNPNSFNPGVGGASFSYEAAARHEVSSNGQVFFETGEALLPRDTDGVIDVYEFDFQSGLHLASAGTSAYDSIFLAASVSGNDVFFLTRQKLVPQDGSQEANKIYDARVEGGFPETASPPDCTTPEACRSVTEPPPSIYGAPSSQTFLGPGNPAPPAEVKPKKKPKPKKKAKRARKACHATKHKRARCATRASRKAKAHHKGGKRS